MLWKGAARQQERAGSEENPRAPESLPGTPAAPRALPTREGDDEYPERCVISELCEGSETFRENASTKRVERRVGRQSAAEC